MSVFLEAINWWYTVVVRNHLIEQVMGTFFFYMNKTRALPFAKTFNVPLYQDTSEFGKSFGKIVKFWWIGTGTIYSIIRTLPAFLIWIFILILPFLPIVGIVRFIFKI